MDLQLLLELFKIMLANADIYSIMDGNLTLSTALLENLMLTFHRSNAKLDALEKMTGKKVYTCSLLSGHTCPFALDCLSKVVIVNGKRKVVDGPHTKFRCFSASQEAQYTPVYNDRLENSLNIRSASREDMALEIADAIPLDAGIIRIHVGGDFMNPNYFLAWLDVANAIPDVTFYAYTKSLPYWVDNRAYVEDTPNMLLTASYGGRRDDLIESENLRSVKVVFSTMEAKELGLELDHDDSHAANPNKRNESFALLLHGTQPPKSEASKALSALKGKGSYSRKKKNVNANV